MVGPVASSCPGPIPGVWRRRHRLPGPDKGPPPQLPAGREVSECSPVPGLEGGGRPVPCRRRHPHPGSPRVRVAGMGYGRGGPGAGSGASVLAGRGVIFFFFKRMQCGVLGANPRAFALCDLLCARRDALPEKGIPFSPPGRSSRGWRARWSLLCYLRRGALRARGGDGPPCSCGLGAGIPLLVLGHPPAPPPWERELSVRRPL